MNTLGRIAVAAFGTVVSTVYASTPLPSGSFAMLDSSMSCANGHSSTCYMTDSGQADKVVRNLQAAGVEYFMIPSALLDEAELLGNAVEQHGGKILSFERWAFQAAVHDGVFSCQDYTQERILKFLLPLKHRFPESFFGLQLKDEAPQGEHDNLGALVQCIRSVPELADLKVFVNLVGVNANAAALYGPTETQAAGVEAPSDYGIDCATNAVVDRTRFSALTDRYTSYVISALDKIKPDYLAFDFYPFNGDMDACPVAREELMTANMSIIAQQSNARGVVPIAYLQNYQQASGNNPHDARHASFHELRWFSAWFYVFGGRGTANFQSHDFDNGAHLGLLDPNNDPRDTATEQQSVFGFTRQVQDATRDYKYLGFVAPWLGVPTGSILGWLPSTQIMTAEFHSEADGSDILVFVRRPNGPVATVTTGLNRWRGQVQKLNFWTGLWETVASSTNAISVDFGDLPAAVYRLRD